MKKFILILTVFYASVFADTYSMEAKYNIYYGFFGNIGESHASLYVDDGTYKVKIKAGATGLAKVLSRNHIESYESSGIVKDSLLVPQLFLIKKVREGKTYIKRYLFDYKKKKITLLKTKKTDKKHTETKKILPFFTPNDILTLFFNLKYILGKDFKTKGQIKLIAAGASDRDGKIDIRSISGKEYTKISKLLGKSNAILAVVINQKIFSSQKGEMFLNLDSNGVCTSALLKDVIMFGDIRGKIKNLKLKEGK